MVKKRQDSSVVPTVVGTPSEMTNANLLNCLSDPELASGEES